MSVTLPTDFMISAQIRTAAASGVPIVVLRRGHDASGTIVLKVNRLDGFAQVLVQVRDGEDLVWTPISGSDVLSDGDADVAMKRQAEIDPDSWLLEIEDRQGRHWFPGKVTAA